MPGKSQPSKVSADLKMNRLNIRLTGSISKKSLQAIYTELRFCVADLRPGFTVITDLSQCRVGYLSGLGIFKGIREYLQSKEVGVVVRVVRKRSLIFRQISKIIDKRGEYEPVYVNTMVEAENYLAQQDPGEPGAGG